MTPTTAQIAEWEKRAEIAWHTDDNISNFDVVERGYIQGYIRARKEQATEIAGLKAKLAEVLPLARFGALVAKGDYLSDDDAIYLELKAGISIDTSGYKTLEYAPNIEATITKLLKD